MSRASRGIRRLIGVPVLVAVGLSLLGCERPAEHAAPGEPASATQTETAERSEWLACLRFRPDIRKLSEEEPESAVEARLSVHNACDHVVILAYEWQGITLELHDDPELDRRVWAADRRFRSDIPPGVPVTTPDVLESTRIPPGSSATPPEFTVSFPVRSILGDSLPGGTYYLALSFAGREMRNPGEPLTQINQPAGRLRLEMD